MARIAAFEIEKWERPILQKELKGHKIMFYDTPLAKRNLKELKDVDAILIFIYSRITEDILKGLPKLKYIATMSTGVDHIDMVACNKRKIKVANVPFYGENTVAEHTMALLLALSRRIPESIDRVKEGNFSPKGLRGFDLKGKTLGIIGVGHIGSHVARMAHGFEMDILGYCRRRDKKLCKETGLKYVTLNYLLKHADIISLHVPLTKETTHMIGKNEFAKMKKGVCIINTARGGIIDTKALLQALNKGIVRGAALDVLEEECSIVEERQLLSSQFECDLSLVLADQMLMKRRDVIITPHNAFNSDEAILRILHTTIQNMRALLKGRAKNLV